MTQRLIDAEDFKAKVGLTIAAGLPVYPAVVMSWIDQQPTAERPTGVWERGKVKYISGVYYKCSNCSGQISDRYGAYDYCPYCGTRMTGIEGDEYWDDI